MADPTGLSLLQWGDKGWSDDLATGALITVELALVSLAAGLAIGLLTAGGKISKHAPVRLLANGYTNLIRGVPEFLVILVVFFGLDQLATTIASSMGLQIDGISKFWAGVAGLSVIFGAYASEVFRGAYLAVPFGQIEAGMACGMSPMRVFFRIRLPQMWRYALPGLGNLWMVLLKDTSLVSVIALDELLRQAKIAGETTRDPFLFYMAAAIIYLVLTIISDVGRQRLEAHVSRGVRRA